MAGDGARGRREGLAPPAPSASWRRPDGHVLSARPVRRREVRRWVRHSVRCWAHATGGSQTRHVAGFWPQQGAPLASRTGASRSARWPRPHWRWVRRDVRHMVRHSPTRSVPFGEHPRGATCGPRERTVTAAEPPAAPVGLQLRARPWQRAAGDAASLAAGEENQPSHVRTRAACPPRAPRVQGGDCHAPRAPPAPRGVHIGHVPEARVRLEGFVVRRTPRHGAA